MNPAFQKTLVFVLLIVIGVLVRKKFKNAIQISGLKVLILSVALPATIFVALLKVKMDLSLLALPALALLFNVVMFGLAWVMLPLAGIPTDSPRGRTLLMLFPSLAPGLSCFPYILEYMGEESLAWAALADLGNKFFVLILLYLLALHWYHRLQRVEAPSSGQSRLKQLALSLVKEPVNLVIIAGLILVGTGNTLETLPAFFQDTMHRLSNMMTPLVLLFIGLAVVIKAHEIKMLFSVLLWRAGLAFLLGALLMVLVPSSPHLLLALIFPLSACSFWPYAHMCAIQTMDGAEERPVFDLNLALAVLALSLPLSTALILMVSSFGEVFIQPINALYTGCLLLILGTMPIALPRLAGKALPERKIVPSGRLNPSTSKTSS